MNDQRGTAPSRLLLCLALYCAAGACPALISGQAGEGGTSEAALREVAASLYLGQAYDTGMLYVESFSPLYGREQEWPQRLLIRPLDEEAVGVTGLVEPVSAQFTGSDLWLVNPRVVEGVLDVAVGSPCAPEDYRARDEVRYVDRNQPRLGWDVRDFFGTNEYTWCGDLGVFGVYDMQYHPERSFRTLAYDADLAVSAVDYELAGTPRGLSEADIETLRTLEAREDCTLGLRSIAEAQQLLRFEVDPLPFTFRISSYVDACTILGEVFLLEILAGEEVLGQTEIYKTRAYP